jgi:hypothetical protein
MAYTPKELSKQVRYTNGSCSVVIYLNYETSTFELIGLETNRASVTDIAELYRQASTYAEQLLAK